MHMDSRYPADLKLSNNNVRRIHLNDNDNNNNIYFCGLYHAQLKQPPTQTFFLPGG